MKLKFSSLLTLAVALNTVSALASDSAVLNLSAANPSQSLSLAGTVSHTIYREEEYETTCSREEPYTAYQTQCDYRTVHHCTTVGGGTSCTPSCHDTTRPVCNSHGCVDVPTHECTQSCSSEPSREVCSDSQEAYNCREVPYTAYRTVTYGCTKTREVPIGTETDKIIAADITLTLSGDVKGLTGKDSVKISVANGNDISRADISIEGAASADTHFLRVTKTENEDNTGDKNVRITANYDIEAIPLASIGGHKSNVTDISANRGAITFQTTGDLIDDSTIVSLVSKKDQLIGGLKTDFTKTVSGKDLQVTNTDKGQQSVLDFGGCVNGRPHEFTVTVTRDAGLLLGGGILNSSSVEKAKTLLSSTLSKRIEMKGDANKCANDGQI